MRETGHSTRLDLLSHTYMFLLSMGLCVFAQRIQNKPRTKHTDTNKQTDTHTHTHTNTHTHTHTHKLQGHGDRKSDSLRTLMWEDDVSHWHFFPL